MTCQHGPRPCVRGTQGPSARAALWLPAQGHVLPTLFAPFRFIRAASHLSFTSRQPLEEALATRQHPQGQAGGAVSREERPAATASRFSGRVVPCALRNGGPQAREGLAAWGCPRALRCPDMPRAATGETIVPRGPLCSPHAAGPWPLALAHLCGGVLSSSSCYVY